MFHCLPKHIRQSTVNQRKTKAVSTLDVDFTCRWQLQTLLLVHARSGAIIICPSKIDSISLFPQKNSREDVAKKLTKGKPGIYLTFFWKQLPPTISKCLTFVPACHNINRAHHLYPWPHGVSCAQRAIFLGSCTVTGWASSLQLCRPKIRIRKTSKNMWNENKVHLCRTFSYVQLSYFSTCRLAMPPGHQVGGKRETNYSRHRWFRINARSH